MPGHAGKQPPADRPTPHQSPQPPPPTTPQTALFESYHLRHDVASAVFNKLPVLKGFPVELVPQAPRPNDSELYLTIKDRWGGCWALLLFGLLLLLLLLLLLAKPPPTIRRQPSAANRPQTRNRGRVRKEVFRGAENRGGHRRGSELAALAVITFAVATYCVYMRWTNFATGLLLGVAGAWIGVTIQHWWVMAVACWAKRQPSRRTEPRRYCLNPTL